MTRGRSMLVALAIALALLSGSTPRVVGDGGEYLAMSLNFAAIRRPALAVADLYWIGREVAEADESLDGWEIPNSSTTGRDGRRDFVHFWMYSLLAAPPMVVVKALGLPVVWAFTIVNLTLLGLAIWLALPRLRGAATLLLFGGPIIWWIDKPHTEAFTFALLAMAFLLMRERPWWSMAAAGLASTQNPPIAVLVPLIAALSVVLRADLRRDRRLWIGLAAGLALAMIQPAYTYIRHGVPTLLLQANPAHVPSLVDVLTVPLDPAIGLLGNYPGWFLFVGGAIALVLRRHWRDVLGIDHLAALISAGVFLLSFSQAPNQHHGATPGLSRYALWLIPLAIPFLRDAAAAGGVSWQRFAWSAAVASSLVSAFAFHPNVLQYSREPTIAARFLWTKHPGWNNPLPEVFSEIMTGGESRFVPAATPGCEKVLLVGRSDGTSFPVPCFPAEVPAECAAAGTLCYANRDGQRYRFTRAPGSQIQLEGFFYQPRAVWPAEAAPHIRQLLTQSQWWTLQPKSSGEDILRQANDVRVRELEGPRRLVFILRDAGSDAWIALRPPWKMTGVLVDGMTGETIRTLDFDGEPYSRWQLKLGVQSPILLVSLWAS
jgi:hypothetical protein